MLITPNTRKLFLAPSPKLLKDHFVYGGRRYFQTASKCLISQYGKHGFLPPIDRGAYEKISTKEFKQAKALYELEKKKYSDQLNGNLNKGVKTQLTFSF